MIPTYLEVDRIALRQSALDGRNGVLRVAIKVVEVTDSVPTKKWSRQVPVELPPFTCYDTWLVSARNAEWIGRLNYRQSWRLLVPTRSRIGQTRPALEADEYIVRRTTISTFTFLEILKLSGQDCLYEETLHMGQNLHRKVASPWYARVLLSQARVGLATSIAEEPSKTYAFFTVYLHSVNISILLDPLEKTVT